MVPQSAPRPFQIAIPDSALVELKARLAKTRWPDAIDDAGWDYGTDRAFLRALCTYWETAFDWRGIEARLNAWPQFTLRVGDGDIHFIHVKGKGPSPKPLVLTHGWPSLGFEYVKVVGPLTDPAAHGGDPADAFDVVAPSLPGYGFSQAATRPGMTPFRIAGLWAELMGALGYERFFAHGSDWGSYVSAILGYRYPERVKGLHMTMVSLAAPTLAAERKISAQKTPEELERTKALQLYRAREQGYSAIQSSKPQTLAYGLNDSPAGLAAWISEKWRAWSDCGGDVEKSFTKDELLTNIALYWFTNSINSSMRLYYENRVKPVMLAEGERVTPPCAFQLFPRDGKPSRRRTELTFNVVRWTEMDRGGHFPALEEPSLLVDDIRALARPLRD